MNKLTIPSILTATVLIAGIFAFMPVEKASTVHTDLEAKMTAVENAVKGEIHKNRFFLETVNLEGVADGSMVVVADTYPNGMGQVHIAATLPVAEAGTPENTCEGGVDGDAPLVDVMAGSAGTALVAVLGANENTGIEGKSNSVDSAFGNGADMCVFHKTIDLATVNGLIRTSNSADSDATNDMPILTKLTDIVVAGKVGALPVDAFITVSGNVLYRP